MKISVSNITWGSENFNSFLEFIKQNGCDGVELAPSLIWNDPIKANSSEIDLVRKNIERNELELVGFHSLLYNKPNLLLFNTDTRIETVNYLKELINICSDLNGKQLVFGSPRNRVLNNRSVDDCLKQAKDDMLSLSEHAQKKNIFFCIEPLSPLETEFLTSIKEGAIFVNNVNHPFFKLHLDTKALYDTKENPQKVINEFQEIIQHVHIGDKNLTAPGTFNKSHKLIGDALNKINYKKFISLEIKKNEKDTKNSIIKSIQFMRENYLNA
tara:strand:- start:88 stop:897 length:810 start_codon:yes stop_codon:yes gene_type:complete